MPIIKHPEQRVAIFIDAANLYHSAKHLYKKHVNFGKILEDAVAGRRLVRAIAYVVSSEEGEEQPFFEALTKLGIETKIKELQVFAGGAKKGDWDVGLAVDAIKMAPRLDAIVIVSGDGDYVPLVEYLQTMTQVEVISFGQSTSGWLIDTADDFLDLSENKRRYLMGGSRRKKAK